jgi:hypothetical protein
MWRPFVCDVKWENKITAETVESLSVDAWAAPHPYLSRLSSGNNACLSYRWVVTHRLVTLKSLCNYIRWYWLRVSGSETQSIFYKKPPFHPNSSHSTPFSPKVEVIHTHIFLYNVSWFYLYTNTQFVQLHGIPVCAFVDVFYFEIINSS